MLSEVLFGSTIFISTTITFVIMRYLMRSESFINRIVCISTPRNSALIAASKSLHSFRPTWWLTSAHAQTIFGSTFRKRPLDAPSHQTVVIESSLDKAKISVHWTSMLKGKPTLVIFHGLTGSVNSNYVQHMMAEANSRGWQVCVLTSRGCGDMPLEVPQGFSATFTGDARDVINHAAEVCGDGPLVAVGFSLGASILIKYLSEQGTETPLRSAVALCCSFDMHASSKLMESGANYWFYNKHLGNNLKKWLVRNGKPFLESKAFDMEYALQATTIKEFDQRVVVPVFGYKDVDEYYTDASNGEERLLRVGIPLLCVNTLDDPISNPAGIPVAAFEQNPNLILVTTTFGGHVAWCTDNVPVNRSWIEAPTMEFLSATVATPL